MNMNVVNFNNYKKAKTLDSNEVAPPLVGTALHEYTRDQYVKILVEKAKANGGYIIGANGDRLKIDENSDYGFEASEAWRDLAPLRAGSEAYNKANNQKAHFVVTAHYPLYGATIYYNYLKKDGMYYSQAFIYQDGETVPTFYFCSWFEEVKDAIALLNDVAEKVLKNILGELKKKYNMSIIDFESTKAIHYRKFKKNII